MNVKKRYTCLTILSILFYSFIQVHTIDFGLERINKLTCGVDSLLAENKFLLVNEDTITLNKEKQHIVTMDPAIAKILKVSPPEDNFPYPSYSYYSIHKNPDLNIFSYIIDEGEYASAHLVIIKDCKLISSQMVAEETLWEHAYKKIRTVFNNDTTFTVTTYTGNKDFGDYKTWNRDTVTTQYRIKYNGEIMKTKPNKL